MSRRSIDAPLDVETDKGWAFIYPVPPQAWLDDPVKRALEARIPDFAKTAADGGGWDLRGEPTTAVAWSHEVTVYDPEARTWVVVESRPVETPEEATIGLYRITWEEAVRR